MRTTDADASKIVGGDAMLQIVRRHYRMMRANQTVAYVKRMEDKVWQPAALPAVIDARMPRCCVSATARPPRTVLEV